MSKRYWLIACYLILLLSSHLTRLERPAALPDGVPRVEVPAIDGDTVTDAKIQLAYKVWTPPQDGGAQPVVLMLHGSPGSSGDFSHLAPRVAQRFPVLAPDLPGFGHSTKRIPDYSIRAHALYCLELLDRLDIKEVHVLGFSMGGGVALHLAELAPERVRSIILLSAIGVQELELLGEYHINHALHGLQLAGLWLLYEAVPHFGAWDDAFLDVAYARNFYDSDQRPLRGILHRLEMPTLILHGEHDVLVPSAAAREHHRLVPQSELVMFDANHFMVFSSDELVSPLLDYLERVDHGEAKTRITAEDERLAAAADPSSGRLPPVTGFPLAILVVVLALSTLLSEDLTCIAAGLLISQGRIGFFAATSACFAGILVGDLALYGLGRLGRPWLSRPPFRWIARPADVRRSTLWFERRGALVILLSRFLPGTRLPTYLAAGLLKTPFLWFALSLILPAIIWTPLLVGLAELLGSRFFAVFETFSRYAFPVFLGLMMMIWLSLAVGKSLATFRGRRLLIGWWRRWRYWEFWPPWVFYPPVVLFILILGLRYRSLTLWTATNPGIPNGGFLGESKSGILAGLNPADVARFRRLPSSCGVDERARYVDAFLREHDLSFPVVLKPDVGQRGAEVSIVRSTAEVRKYLQRNEVDTIVQEFIEGRELGVFYVRMPDKEHGRIFSVTDKRLPWVTGDGRSSLERLILADRRAVAVAPIYFRQLAERVNQIPAPGEKVVLVEVGTHCRGAVFLDGGEHATPELEVWIDRVAKTCEGFYFGRFDLRAPSITDFRRGRDIRVLELNGVTSEATHIYDPENRLRDAYRVLFEQWRLAFKVGKLNRDRGVKPSSLRELARQIWSYRQLTLSRRRSVRT